VLDCSAVPLARHLTEHEAALVVHEPVYVSRLAALVASPDSARRQISVASYSSSVTIVRAASTSSVWAD
jgi:hypothetical protein